MIKPDGKISAGMNPVVPPSASQLLEIEAENFSRAASERKESADFVRRASKAVRRLLWLVDDESLEKVRVQAEGVKAVLKTETESGNRFSRENCEKSNSNCGSCWSTGKHIVNKLGKRTSTESVYTGTKMRLVTIVKGIPIYAPEDVYEDRDRTDPLHILHCNACGNEWEKRDPRYETDRWALEDYLDYVRYSATATAKGESDSHWLTEHALKRLKSKSGWELPYIETVALLAKESRYDKFGMADRRGLKKFLKSVLDDA